MKIFRTKSEVRDYIINAKASSKSIAFVPTMGALHKGHASLVEIAKQKADLVITSIFVNPTQFGANEDLSKYPRTENEDIELLTNLKCDIAFIPIASKVYSGEPLFKISPQYKTDILCGKFRPSHFEGVCLVVTKLFNIINPDFAIFGEKDFQQLHIIRKLVAELDFNIKIISAPTFREQDGLAMSSRNKYLSDEERKIAGKLNVILKSAIENFKSDKDKNFLIEKYKNEILSAGFNKLDYLEFRQETDLRETETFDENTRVFFAGYVGKTRLIDNLKI